MLNSLAKSTASTEKESTTMGAADGDGGGERNNDGGGEKLCCRYRVFFFDKVCMGFDKTTIH